MKSEKFIELVVKYINNSITSSELVEITEYLKEDKYDKVFKYYIETNYVIDYKMKEFDTKVAKQELIDFIRKEKKLKKKKLMIFYRYAAAASIALLIALPFSLKKLDFNFNNEPEVVQQPILPGSDKAILTLEDGQHIALKKGKSYNSEKLNSNGENLVYSKNLSKSSKNIAYNYLTIPRGGQFFVELSDGTKVWLNSESKLKYPVNFDKNRTREVELIYGEAYFDVTHSIKNNGTKFKVNSKVQDVVVLGTQFNIKAYNNQPNILTTLVKGKVVVSNGISKETLSPGLQSNVNIEEDKMLVKQVNTAYEVAWRYGFFRFKDKPLDEMLKTLARWYNVEISFEDKSKKEIVYSGVLKRTNAIEELLNTIQKTGNVEFKINNKQIIVK